MPAARQTRPNEAGSRSEDGRKLVIEKLTIRKGTIRVRAALLKGKETEVSFPALEFRNIGKERNGTSPNEVAAKVLDAITRQVVMATAGLGLEAVYGLAEEGAEGVGAILEEGIEGIGEAIEGLFGE